MRRAHAKRVMVVFGTRPEAIKLAPILRLLEESPLLDPVVVVTGQHRRMLDDVLEAFRIEPDFDLGLLEARQSLADVTARALTRLAPVIEATKPDLAIVQGDTATTFAGALAAFYQRVPVAHVEAGLRTYDAQAPFPEEANRRLTALITDLHLAPTPSTKRNLVAEGVDPGRVVVTGNTVIDALQRALELERGFSDPALRDVESDPRRLLLVTAHRRESWGAPLTEIGRAVAEIARRHADLLVVLPIHRNPVVRERLLREVGTVPNVLVVEPQPYPAFVRLMARANLILTDSGGVQEEAPSLGKRVLVMRDVTERHEAMGSGAARLVGTSRAEIVAAVSAELHDDLLADDGEANVSPYGDGQAARRCVAAIANLLGLGPTQEDFAPAEPSRLVVQAAR